MKTKLLKKVRKRFSIIRIDKLGKYPTEVSYWRAARYGLPYYRMVDNNAIHDLGLCESSLESILNRLMRLIKLEYPQKPKGNPEISTKVWWNK